MRLSDQQAAGIKAAAVEAFGPDVVVRLFGSRVAEDARGGDIDVHIEASQEAADLDHEIRFRALVWKLLDESQIDVVVASRGAPERWVDSAARREGIVL